MSEAKSRHRGKRMDLDMPYADIPRFERLTPGCKTPRQRILKLMELLEKQQKPKEIIKEKVVYVDKIVEKEVPKIEYRDRIVEKPIEKIVEKPIYVDKIVEKPIEVVIDDKVKAELEETKQFLKIEKVLHENEKGEYTKRNKELESIIKAEQMTKTSIIGTVTSSLRDLRIYFPKTMENQYKVSEYLGTLRQVINDLEGYLRTVSN